MTVPSTVPSTKRNPTTIIVPLVTLVVGAGIGYGWATRMPAGTTTSLSPGELRACYDEATKTLAAAGIIEPDHELRAITGTVHSVSGNSVLLTVKPLGRNPLAEATPTERRVTLATETELFLRVMRDESEYLAEMQTYQDAQFAAAEGDVDTATAPVVPPMPLPYTEQTITLSDLKEGMMVYVTADTDVLRAEAFTATTLAVIQQTETDREPADDTSPEPSSKDVEPPTEDI